MDLPPGFDSLGHETPEEDLAALRELGRRQFVDAGPVSCAHLEAVEVGSWAGRTALVLTEYFSKVYCVDHWLGNHGDRLGDLAKQYGPGHAWMTFCRNMGGRLMTQVIPCRGSSTTWASIWPRKVDLVFIDASHEYGDVLEDIAAWLPHVRPGGIICGHDHGVFPGVDRAVAELLPNRNLMGRTIWWHQIPQP